MTHPDWAPEFPMPAEIPPVDGHVTLVFTGLGSPVRDMDICEPCWPSRRARETSAELDQILGITS